MATEIDAGQQPIQLDLSKTTLSAPTHPTGDFNGRIKGIVFIPQDPVANKAAQYRLDIIPNPGQQNITGQEGIVARYYLPVPAEKTMFKWLEAICSIQNLHPDVVKQKIQPNANIPLGTLFPPSHPVRYSVREETYTGADGSEKKTNRVHLFIPEAFRVSANAAGGGQQQPGMGGGQQQPQSGMGGSTFGSGGGGSTFGGGGGTDPFGATGGGGNAGGGTGGANPFG